MPFKGNIYFWQKFLLLVRSLGKSAWIYKISFRTFNYAFIWKNWKPKPFFQILKVESWVFLLHHSSLYLAPYREKFWSIFLFLKFLKNLKFLINGHKYWLFEINEIKLKKIPWSVGSITLYTAEYNAKTADPL